MNAVVQSLPVTFRRFCPMSNTPFTVHIDTELLAQFRALGQRCHFEMDEIVEAMMRDLIFRLSPQSADPDHPETRSRLEAGIGLVQSLRGEVVPQEQVEAQFRELLGRDAWPAKDGR